MRQLGEMFFNKMGYIEMQDHINMLMRMQETCI